MDDYLTARRNEDTTLWMRTFLKFERALANHVTEPEYSKKIWNSLMFYNYIQRFMVGPRMAPTSEDYKSAREKFLTLMALYEPDWVIVWGQRLYDWLPGDRGKAIDLSFDEDMDCWEYEMKDGHKTIVLPIFHPASGFDWEYWNYVIEQSFKEN